MFQIWRNKKFFEECNCKGFSEENKGAKKSIISTTAISTASFDLEFFQIRYFSWFYIDSSSIFRKYNFNTKLGAGLG